MLAGAPSYEAPDDVEKVLIDAGASNWKIFVKNHDAIPHCHKISSPNANLLCHKVGSKPVTLLSYDHLFMIVNRDFCSTIATR